MHVLSQDQLPTANEFEGEDHGGLGVSFLLVDASTGDGPALHQHAYPEVFIVHKGQSMFVDGDEEREARAGQIVVVPGDTPHRFFNSGEGPPRQIDIHVSPRSSPNGSRDKMTRVRSHRLSCQPVQLRWGDHARL